MGCKQSEEPEFFGIYSPIYHDLRVPFGLTFSHLLSQKKETLFLDAEQFSVLPYLIPNENFTMDFMDMIYLLKSEKDDFDLKKYIFYFEDIAMLPVTKNPGDFALVEADIWVLLYRKIKELGYRIVILFDTLNATLENLLPFMDELILLGRQEDYYQYTIETCSEYFSTMEDEPKIHKVELNMSASGLREGSFSMKKLMEGNMAGFIKNEFKGSPAIAGT